MIAVIRIAGRAKNKKKDEETLKRLKLDRKFSCVLIEAKDEVRKGMVASVKHMVTFGKITPEMNKELDKKRPAKEGVYHLHPPRGGFKKSSKMAAPKGILGKQEDISKLLERML